MRLSPWLIVVPIVAVCLLGMLGLTAVRSAGTARRVSKRSAWLTVIGFLILVAALSRLDLDRTTAEEPATFEIAPPTTDGGGQSTSWPTWLVVGAAVIAAPKTSRRSPRTTLNRPGGPSTRRWPTWPHRESRGRP